MRVRRVRAACALILALCGAALGPEPALGGNGEWEPGSSLLQEGRHGDPMPDGQGGALVPIVAEHGTPGTGAYRAMLQVYQRNADGSSRLLGSPVLNVDARAVVANPVVRTRHWEGGTMVLVAWQERLPGEPWRTHVRQELRSGSHIEWMLVGGAPANLDAGHDATDPDIGDWGLVFTERDGAGRLRPVYRPFPAVTGDRLQGAWEDGVTLDIADGGQPQSVQSPVRFIATWNQVVWVAGGRLHGRVDPGWAWQELDLSNLPPARVDTSARRSQITVAYGPHGPTPRIAYLTAEGEIEAFYIGDQQPPESLGSPSRRAGIPVFGLSRRALIDTTRPALVLTYDGRVARRLNRGFNVRPIAVIRRLARVEGVLAPLGDWERAGGGTPTDPTATDAVNDVNATPLCIVGGALTIAWDGQDAANGGRGWRLSTSTLPAGDGR